MSGWSCDCCCYFSTFKSAAGCCQKGRPTQTEEACSQHQWLNELQWDVQTVVSSSPRRVHPFSPKMWLLSPLKCYLRQRSTRKSVGNTGMEETEAFHRSTPKISLPGGIHVYAENSVHLITSHQSLHPPTQNEMCSCYGSQHERTICLVRVDPEL